MDDDEGGADVQSILTYGAKTLFDEGEQESREIVCEYSVQRLLAHVSKHHSDTDHDLDALIERTENEEVVEESGKEGGGANAAFSFAKIWTADKDALEEFPDDVSEKPEESDSWALTLQRLAEQNKEAEVAQVSGRGARRAAAAAVAALKPQVRSLCSVRFLILTFCSIRSTLVTHPRSRRARASRMQNRLL